MVQTTLLKLSYGLLLAVAVAMPICWFMGWL